MSLSKKSAIHKNYIKIKGTNDVPFKIADPSILFAGQITRGERNPVHGAPLKPIFYQTGHLHALTAHTTSG